MTLDQVLEAAAQASRDAAQAQWDRDGHKDCGSCGGAMMQLDSRTKIAKRAVELKLAYQSGKDIFVMAPEPEGIASQHGAIPQAAMRAFRETLVERGYASAVKKFWTYVD